MLNSDKKVQNQWTFPEQNPGGLQQPPIFRGQNQAGMNRMINSYRMPPPNIQIRQPFQQGYPGTPNGAPYMPQQYIQAPIHPQHQQFIYAAPIGVRNPIPMQPSPYGAVPSTGGRGYNTYAPAAGLQTSAAAQPQQNIYSQQPFFAQGGISYAWGPGGQYQPMVYQPQQTMPQPQQVVPQQQVVPPQQQQIAVTQPPPSLAKREKKILQFINPNTGRSIFNNGVSQSAATTPSAGGPPPSIGAPKELNAGPGASAGEDKHLESSVVKQDDSKHSHLPPSTATTIPQHPPPSMANSGPTGQAGLYETGRMKFLKPVYIVGTGQGWPVMGNWQDFTGTTGFAGQGAVVGVGTGQANFAGDGFGFAAGVGQTQIVGNGQINVNNMPWLL